MPLKYFRFPLFASLILLLAACALGDAANPTPLSPITLEPAPEAQFIGDCNNTKALETWLQVTTGLLTEFLDTMNLAATKNRQDAYQDVLKMATTRDAISSLVTPDCAAEAQLKLLDTMNTVIAAFQAFANGEQPDISQVVTEATIQFDQVTAWQNELIIRMESQFQQGIGQG